MGRGHYLGLGLLLLVAALGHTTQAAVPGPLTDRPTPQALPPYLAPTNGTNSTSGNATVASTPVNPFLPGPGEATLPPATEALHPGTAVVPSDLAAGATKGEAPMVSAPPLPGGALLSLLLAAAAFGLGPSKFGLNLLPLFSRLTHDEMLQHEVRRNIVRYVEDHPGIHYSALRRALALPNGTLSFHLRSLERTGYLHARKFGIRLHLFAGDHPPDPSPEDVLLPPRVNLLGYLRDHPGATQRELGRALNLLPSRVNYHIRALASLGLVDVQRVGRATKCYATGQARPRQAEGRDPWKHPARGATKNWGEPPPGGPRR